MAGYYDLFLSSYHMDYFIQGVAFKSPQTMMYFYIRVCGDLTATPCIDTLIIIRTNVMVSNISSPATIF